MQKIPVFATCAAAYRFFWNRLGTFANLVYPAVVILAILNVLTGMVAEVPVTARLGGFLVVAAPLLVLARLLASLFFTCTFAVGWHRRYLMPGETVTVRDVLRWRRRHTRFLLTSIGLGLAMIIVGLVLSLAARAFFPAAVAVVVAVVLFFVSLYVTSRLSLMFPQIAVENRWSIGDAWSLTRGNGVRLLVIGFIVQLPIAISIFVVAIVFGLTSVMTSLTTSSPFLLVVMLVFQFIAFVSIALGVSVLSIAYQTLGGAPPRTV